jgi:hypothetical protein
VLEKEAEEKMGTFPGWGQTFGHFGSHDAPTESIPHAEPQPASAAGSG